jgi:hypothetical protein
MVRLLFVPQQLRSILGGLVCALSALPAQGQVNAGDSFLIDFGHEELKSPTEGGEIWNNIAGEPGKRFNPSVEKLLPVLVNDAGEERGVSFDIIENAKQAGVGGSVYNKNQIAFEQKAAKDSIFVQGPVRFQFEGLNPALNYELTLYGGVPENVEGSRNTRVSISSEVFEFEARGNQEQLVVFTKLRCEEDGTLSFEAAPGENSTQGTLNFLILKALP